jgi:pimeloyl-ACP methyl ester carboxylesterase
MTHQGQRPRVVFLPGLGAPEYLRPWVALTARWAEAEVLDLPGWRRGRADTCPPTIDGIAGETIRRLAHGTGRPAVLIGHSTAAQCAALVAQAAADRLAGVVLAAPTFDPAMAGWPGLAGRAVRTARHEKPAELAAVVPRYLRGGVRPVLRLLRDGLRHGAGVYQRVPVPVLVLAGRHDHLAPPEWARRLAGHLGAPVEVLPGGHNFGFTHPPDADAAVRAAVTRWSAPA